MNRNCFILINFTKLWTLLRNLINPKTLEQSFKINNNEATIIFIFETTIIFRVKFPELILAYLLWTFYNWDLRWSNFHCRRCLNWRNKLNCEVVVSTGNKEVKQFWLQSRYNYLMTEIPLISTTMYEGTLYCQVLIKYQRV